MVVQEVYGPSDKTKRAYYLLGDNTAETGFSPLTIGSAGNSMFFLEPPAAVYLNPARIGDYTDAEKFSLNAGMNWFSSIVYGYETGDRQGRVTDRTQFFSLPPLFNGGGCFRIHGPLSAGIGVNPIRDFYFAHDVEDYHNTTGFSEHIYRYSHESHGGLYGGSIGLCLDIFKGLSVGSSGTFMYGKAVFDYPLTPNGRAILWGFGVTAGAEYKTRVFRDSYKGTAYALRFRYSDWVNLDIERPYFAPEESGEYRLRYPYEIAASALIKYTDNYFELKMASVIPPRVYIESFDNDIFSPFLNTTYSWGLSYEKSLAPNEAMRMGLSFYNDGRVNVGFGRSFFNAQDKLIFDLGVGIGFDKESTHIAFAAGIEAIDIEDKIQTNE